MQDGLLEHKIEIHSRALYCEFQQQEWKHLVLGRVGQSLEYGGQCARIKSRD